MNQLVTNHAARPGAGGSSVCSGCCGSVPNNIRPNVTDPHNTASNGPAVLNEDTIGSYRASAASPVPARPPPPRMIW